MNVSSFHPLMHSPQLMSPHLQPSPFSPGQFLTSSTTTPTTPPSTPASASDCHPDPHAESSDEEMSSPHTFIKKRPLEVTEDLVEGRIETASQRLRRRASRRATLRGCPHPPQLFAPTMGVEPMTPPNRSASPMSFFSCDMTLAPASECPSHSPQPRRTPKNRRSTKVKRACTTRKSPRESSPALVRSRSPLGRWTPPAVSAAFQLFSVQPNELPTTPPRRPSISSYSFESQPRVWTNNIPWTIASPSSSPYPSHSPPPHSHHQP